MTEFKLEDFVDVDKARAAFGERELGYFKLLVIRFTPQKNPDDVVSQDPIAVSREEYERGGPWVLCQDPVEDSVRGDRIVFDSHWIYFKKATCPGWQVKLMDMVRERYPDIEV